MGAGWEWKRRGGQCGKGRKGKGEMKYFVICDLWLWKCFSTTKDGIISLGGAKGAIFRSANWLTGKTRCTVNVNDLWLFLFSFKVVYR